MFERRQFISSVLIYRKRAQRKKRKKRLFELKNEPMGGGGTVAHTAPFESATARRHVVHHFFHPASVSGPAFSAPG